MTCFRPHNGDLISCRFQGYNALLSGLATSDHWKKALQVAEGMKQKSVARKKFLGSVA